MRVRERTLVLSGEWAPPGLRFQMDGNSSHGLQMRSTKEECSSKNLVSNKYKIHMVQRPRKSCTYLSVKRLFYPFWLKTSGLALDTDGMNMKVVNINKIFQKKLKS